EPFKLVPVQCPAGPGQRSDHGHRPRGFSGRRLHQGLEQDYPSGGAKVMRANSPGTLLVVGLFCVVFLSTSLPVSRAQLPKGGGLLLAHGTVTDAAGKKDDLDGKVTISFSGGNLGEFHSD